MSELINRAELIVHLDECIAESDGHTPIVDAVLMAVKSAIEKMPTVDAVPVVYCRECIKRGTYRCPLYPKDEIDDFCSYGERRNND